MNLLPLKKELPVSAWLDVLSAVLPARGVLVVGAGSGNGHWVPWLRQSGIRPVRLVEGDAEQYQHLLRHYPVEEGWQPCRDVVVGEASDARFHKLNNPRESGLLPPEPLHALWPNLQSVAVDGLDSSGVSLGELLDEGDINWLVLDCLPAASLLQGGIQHLATLDLVVVRGVTTLDLPGAGLHEVDALLSDAGLRRVHTLPERHPGLAHAFYARDISEIRNGHDYLQQMLQQSQQAAVQQHALAQEKMAETRHKQERLQIELQAQNEKIDQLSIALADAELEIKEKQEQFALRCQELKEGKMMLGRQLKILEKNLEEQRGLVANLSLPASSVVKNGDGKPVAIGKTDISGLDDFIRDVEPFFYGKSITYVDVGAFRGDVFKYFCDGKLLKIREAHLFEPNPESYLRLSEVVQESKIPSIHAYQMALSAVSDPQCFSMAGSMTKMVSFPGGPLSSSNTFVSQSATLDEMSNAFTDRRIDLLKIDVEGAELLVLKGAHTLLEDGRVDVVYLEVGLNVDGTQQTYFGDLDRFMQGYGYRCFKIYEQTAEWIQDSPCLRRCNVAYFSRRFAANNPYRTTMELRALRAAAR